MISGVLGHSGVELGRFGDSILALSSSGRRGEMMLVAGGCMQHLLSMGVAVRALALSQAQRSSGTRGDELEIIADRLALIDSKSS